MQLSQAGPRGLVTGPADVWLLLKPVSQSAPSSAAPVPAKGPDTICLSLLKSSSTLRA